MKSRKDSTFIDMVSPRSNPLRTSLLWAYVLGLAAVGGFTAGCVMGPAMGAWGAGLAGALVLGAAGPWVRAEARLLALLAASTIVAMTVVPPVWPLVQLAVGAPAVVAAWRVPSLRLPTPWLARGRFDPWPVVALGLVAALALVGWAWGTSPDLRGAMAMVPAWPLPLLIAAALGFSIVNAILEEVVFRGLLQGLLRTWLGPGVAPLLLQGAAFGVLHWHGVPSGWLGALMAGSWGVMLGWARRRSGGLLTPVVAHVAADVVIFTLLARLAHACSGPVQLEAWNRLPSAS